jgi:hypothetical protein
MVKYFELSISCRSYRNASHCLTLDVQDNENKNTGKGFSEGDGSFILNKDGYLEFKLTQSSVDVVIYLVSIEPNRTVHSKGS